MATPASLCAGSLKGVAEHMGYKGQWTAMIERPRTDGCNERMARKLVHQGVEADT